MCLREREMCRFAKTFYRKWRVAGTSCSTHTHTHTHTHTERERERERQYLHDHPRDTCANPSRTEARKFTISPRLWGAWGLRYPALCGSPNSSVCLSISLTHTYTTHTTGNIETVVEAICAFEQHTGTRLASCAVSSTATPQIFNGIHGACQPMCM